MAVGCSLQDELPHTGLDRDSGMVDRNLRHHIIEGCTHDLNEFWAVIGHGGISAGRRKDCCVRAQPPYTNPRLDSRIRDRSIPITATRINRPFPENKKGWHELAKAAVPPFRLVSRDAAVRAGSRSLEPIQNLIGPEALQPMQRLVQR